MDLRGTPSKTTPASKDSPHLQTFSLLKISSIFLLHQLDFSGKFFNLLLCGMNSSGGAVGILKCELQFKSQADWRDRRNISPLLGCGSVSCKAGWRFNRLQMVELEISGFEQVVFVARSMNRKSSVQILAQSGHRQMTYLLLLS